MNKVPDLEDAYKELSWVFMKAFGYVYGLRDSGVLETQDIIHSFLLKRWANIEKRYHPSKGSVEGYVFKAFLNFARAEVRREQNQRKLYEQSQGADRSVNPEPDPSQDRATQLASVQENRAHLTYRQRAMLEFFFQMRSPSISGVAERFELTDYFARKELVVAYALMIDRVAVPDTITERDWEVTHLLLREKRTELSTATRLKMTKHQIKTIHKNNLHIIAQNLFG